MDIYNDTLRNLPTAEKLRLVEQLWDDIGNSEPLPIPPWALNEAAHRRDDMIADPQLGLTHDDVWKQIEESRDA